MTKESNRSHDIYYISDKENGPVWKCRKCSRFWIDTSPYSSWEICTPMTKGDDSN